MLVTHTLQSFIASGLEHQYDGPNKHLFLPSKGFVFFGSDLSSFDSSESLLPFDSFDSLELTDSCPSEILKKNLNE